MNIGKPLFWHQGLFLQPQHFQYVDALHQAGAHALSRELAPHHWGLVELDIDPVRLASGVFELRRVAAMFPDGSLVAAPANAVVAPRDFRSAWTDQREPLLVYLGLRRPGTDANVSMVPDLQAAAGADTRFAALAEPEPVSDFYQGGGSTVALKTLHHVLRLFWHSELDGAEHYELIPVARLVRDGDSIQLDPAYAPPSMTVQAAPVLLGLLRELRDEVIGRAHQLEEYKGSASATSGEFSSKLLRYRMALQTLARYAPLLSHLAEAPAVHPWQVYGLMRQLVGEMSVFSVQVDVLGTPAGVGASLPSYDHLQAGACYTAARDLTERLLNEITLGPEQMVKLERVEGRLQAELPRDFLDRSSSLYLVVRTETAFEDLLDSFHSFAKLGAAEQVDVYARRALPGLAASYLRVRPESLPHRPNASYFRLNRNDAPWEAVETERTLALLWDDAPADLRAELVLVRG